MEVTLTKQKTFKLEPFGRFTIKFLKRNKNIAPRTIPLFELECEHETAYPLGDFENEFVKLMKKHKTDIFTDGSYFGFYTRTGSGMTRVFHQKFIDYRENKGGFKDVVDGEL
ncbi:MAG: hypothetical protein M0R03_15535 [Novosphingobium sp.]|nr:hypothetical protein [Novosphingobium sp.]